MARAKLEIVGNGTLELKDLAFLPPQWHSYHHNTPPNYNASLSAKGATYESERVAPGFHISRLRRLDHATLGH